MFIYSFGMKYTGSCTLYENFMARKFLVSGVNSSTKLGIGRRRRSQPRKSLFGSSSDGVNVGKVIDRSHAAIVVLLEVKERGVPPKAIEQVEFGASRDKRIKLQRIR